MPSPARATASGLLAVAALALTTSPAAAAVDLAPPTVASLQVNGDVSAVAVGTSNPGDAIRDLFLAYSASGTPQLSIRTSIAAHGVWTTSVGVSSQGIAAPGAIADLAVRDVTGDGADDVVVATSNGVGYIRRTGVADFSPYGPFVSVASGTYSAVAIGQWIESSAGPEGIAARADGTLVILQHSGTASTPYLATSTVSSTNASPVAVAVADTDGDGHDDIVVASFGRLEIIRGDGTGGVAGRIDRLLPSVPSALAVGDLDADGRPDVVVTQPDDHAVRWFPSANELTAPDPGRSLPLGRRPTDVAIADLDGDGRPEIVTADPGTGTVTVVAAGVAPTSFATAGAPTWLAVDELTGDARRDVLAVDATGRTSQILANRGPTVTLTSATAIDAGAVLPGAIAPAATLTVTAGGGAGLRLGTLGVVGDHAGDFLLGADACDGVELAPGASCAVTVRFAPSAAGARTAVLRIPSAGGALQTVALAGTGTVPATPPPTIPPPVVPPVVTPKPAATITCTLVRAKGSTAVTGVNCTARLTGGATARRLVARLAKGRTPLATVTITKGRVLKLRPKRALAKGAYTVTLTVTQVSGKALTATRAVTVR